ncbi:MAG: hypothetical protein HYT12_01660 [Candidatus Liptonbacteria bacterium]|nr:hypothetical protein [Candidatus Liptonbacteria bacterium]
MASAFKKTITLEDNRMLLDKKNAGADEDSFEDGFNIDDGMYFKSADDNQNDDGSSKEDEEDDDPDLDYDEEEDGEESL